MSTRRTRSGRHKRLRRRLTLRTVAVAGVLVGASIFATATPASASEGACKGPFWGVFRQNICVVANMGGKWADAHAQWVGYVEGKQASYGDVPNHLVEIWGDGFYYADWGYVSHDINGWVHDGTNICAAETEPISGTRQIACIAIHVP